MEALHSSSLGAMGSLLRKLDELLHTKDRAQGLIDNLRTISTKLEKLSEVCEPPLTVKYWMNDARELSYDMEACVDQFIHDRQPDALSDKVPWIKEILRFTARVQEVNERCDRYNLVNKYVLGSSTNFAVRHHLHTPNEEPELVEPIGMEEPINKLLEWLKSKDNGEDDLKLKVVSILGDEGVGKSTLVKRLWRASEGMFDCRAFVQTAKKPDTRMILRSMLSQVCPKQSPKVCSVPKLIENLRDHLQDKRYFIVIDDLWDVSVWHIVRRAFPDGNYKIITTTASEKVAQACCSYDRNNIVNAKRLSEDQTKKLFVHTAFGSGKGCPPQLNVVTDEITRKCGGLPLAIIYMARLVAGKTETEQKEQLDYVSNFLPNNLRTRSSSMAILKPVVNLCYSRLPHCLKTCLLYLSVYPENYLFLKEDLVKQWIAEDFISTPEGKDIVDVAVSYFDELVNLGLIQRMDISDSNRKALVSYIVHPVVFDFITSKSMEDNFITIIDYSQSTAVLTEKVRRLTLHFGSATYATTPPSVELSQVRSLAFMGLLGCMPSVAEFRLVRVVILHICSDDGDTRVSLSEICKLLLLRYLQVRCNVTVELPDQLQCLKHLETLEINAGVESVPSDLFHLTRLLHLHLGGKTNVNPGHITSVKAVSSVDSSSVPSPPFFLQRVELLPGVCIFPRLPKWICQLVKLHILEIVVREYSTDDINALAELPALKALSFHVRRPNARYIVFNKGMFPALEYFKFVCGVLRLSFREETMPNLQRLKLGFNAHKSGQYNTILVGIKYLRNLQKISATIGAAPDAEESDRRAAESAFKYAIRKHPCHQSFERVKRVDRVDEDYDPSEELSSGQQEESSNERGQVPTWKLMFRNPPQLPIYTGSMIKSTYGYGGPLEINLVDVDTGSLVALSQALRVELVPLFGDIPSDSCEDWGPKEFEKAIVMERGGKGPLLTGDIIATMRDGRATVGHVQFTDNSSWVRCRKFRIGARVLLGSYDGARIREAMTEAFVVRDRRIKPYQKHHPPDQDAHNIQLLHNATYRWKLAFRTPLMLPVFTGSKIEDISGKPLEIILVDMGTGSPAMLPQMLHVELVPLFGNFPPDDRVDWAPEAFQKAIVKEREGKRPLLTGDISVTMRDGRATVGHVQFTDKSSLVRCGTFRIGARVVPGSYDGARIREAMTEAFIVSDYPSGLKHYPPILDDEVWRLEKIGKGGALNMILRENNIVTVQEFVTMLMVKPDELHVILKGCMSNSMWEATTKHAMTCDPGDKVYMYSTAHGTLYVDSIFKAVKVVIGGTEWPLQQLNRDQARFVQKLILEAYEHRHNLQETDEVTLHDDGTNNIPRLLLNATHATQEPEDVIEKNSTTSFPFPADDAIYATQGPEDLKKASTSTGPSSSKSSMCEHTE